VRTAFRKHYVTNHIVVISWSLLLLMFVVIGVGIVVLAGAIGHVGEKLNACALLACLLLTGPVVNYWVWPYILAYREDHNVNDELQKLFREIEDPKRRLVVKNIHTEIVRMYYQIGRIRRREPLPEPPPDDDFRGGAAGGDHDELRRQHHDKVVVTKLIGVTLL
jgi:hypothetical protein